MLEVGKSYTLNDGREFKCTRMTGDDPNAVDEYGYGPFVLNGCFYHKDGTFAAGGCDELNVMLDKEIEPINTIQVGETYTDKSGTDRECIAVRGDVAWMFIVEGTTAYTWDANTGVSIDLGPQNNIDLTQKPVRETVEYVGHWDGETYDFYNEHSKYVDCHPVRITFETVDGIPDWSTLKAEDVK